MLCLPFIGFILFLHNMLLFYMHKLSVKQAQVRYEPPRGKTNMVSKQVRHKSGLYSHRSRLEA